jgi:hypothetical protein
MALIPQRRKVCRGRSLEDAFGVSIFEPPNLRILLTSAGAVSVTAFETHC